MSGSLPVEQLLQQCLLLPIFADLGMAVVLLRSARGRAGGALAALLSVLFLAATAQLVPEWPAWYQAGPAFGALVGPVLLWFLLAYSGGKRMAGASGWLPVIILLPAFLFLAAALAIGWPPSHPAYLLLSAAYFAPAAALFAFSYHAGILLGKEPELIAAALVVLFISGPVYSFAYSGIVPLTLFPYASAVSGGMLTFLVVRYKSFSFSPAVEESLKGEPELKIATGLFLARADRTGRVRSLFVDAVRHGIPGLAVTQTHPVEFRRQTGFKSIPVIWLAHSTYEKSLPPGEPDILLHALKDYVTRSERSVVLLENLDYLITNAGLYPTFDMLRGLMEAARRSGAVFLLSSELLTPDERRELADLGIKALR
jgi:hypothetical protein